MEAENSSPTGVIVPLYVYPGERWDTVASAKKNHPLVPIITVINPSNGAGNRRDPNYFEGIRRLQSAGVVVLGYIYTNYARRRADEILQEIDAYRDWYSADGIAFDEMTNTLGHERYYARLNDYASSLGLGFTSANPGTDTLPSYIGTANTLVIHERMGLPPLAYLGGWHAHFNKANFALIAYGVHGLPRSFVREGSRYLGYLYLTDDGPPNPYDTLPSYFSELVSLLDECARAPSQATEVERVPMPRSYSGDVPSSLARANKRIVDAGRRLSRYLLE